jgi:hypothetical protein
MPFFETRLWRQILGPVSISVAFGLVMRLLFGHQDIGIFMDFLLVMSLSFLILVPYGIGYLTVWFLPKSDISSKWYCALIPWLPVVLLMFITICIKSEGWICWIMALPIFMFFSTIGGLTARRHRLKGSKNKTYVFITVLLPLFAAPIEHLVHAIPGTYTANTSIIIEAPADSIWNNLTRVRYIPEANFKGSLTSLMGFPRPIKAELNYEGVGATRAAIFDKGLVFQEKVLEYEPKKRMVFSIHANPYDIPSTTMDEHIVVGGDYFDVLTGTYELEPLDQGKYCLHLYSRFVLKTDFNFYASWWGRWIMQDIQNNILHVIRDRAEGKMN